MSYWLLVTGYHSSITNHQYYFITKGGNKLQYEISSCVETILIKMTEFEQEGTEGSAKIKVIGVGGGGSNAVKRMIEAQLQGVEFYVVNTDLQALRTCGNAIQVPIGTSITHGLGAGADPELGKKAADEDREELEKVVEGADMVFVTAGMGGGTGTGASPIIAELARNLGALTISVVTRPFTFEGRRRAERAEEGIENLKDCADAQIVIPNQRLIDVVERKTPIRTAFRMADEVLLHGVKSISNLITISGEINVDFADVRTIMKDAGVAIMGIGIASGDERSKAAAENAITCPLLEDGSIEGATGVLVNVTGPSDMLLHELDDAMNVVYAAVNEDANVIFGLVYSDDMNDEFQVTVIATRFDRRAEQIKGTEAIDIEDFVSKNFIKKEATRKRPIEKGRRQNRFSADSRQSRQTQRERSSQSNEDTWDIPTFFRRRSKE